MADGAARGFAKDEDSKNRQYPLSAGDSQNVDSQKGAHLHSTELVGSGVILGDVTEARGAVRDPQINNTDSKNSVGNSLDEAVSPKHTGPEPCGDLECYEEDEDEDEWMSEEGDESDVEDNIELAFPLRRRESNPVLPDTVTALEAAEGCKVYVVGTAHFSTESQEDVSNMIRAVQPDVVMVELCKSRINILELDEAMLLEEAKNINLEKFRLAVKQSGVVQGIMHLLLLSMSAHLTKQLGMAPGGEFRRAFQEARMVPGCRLQLGDRPIQITLKRALGALSVWQKLKLAWYLITTKDPISKEDVEKCKQRDLLEQLLKEMTGEFPALSQVFVEERDVFLTHSLKMAARPREHPGKPEGKTKDSRWFRLIAPTVVVGVVGIGHVPGIIANWPKEQDIKSIITIPSGSMLGKVVRWSIRASLLCVLSYGCYRLYRWTSHTLL
ncbi:hypothetical protein ACOMHN_048413 [Nucella lapillus]